MKERCKKCYGKGHCFKPGGFTKADLIPCSKCGGSGEVPKGSQKKYGSNNKGVYYAKWQGIQNLDKLEEV